MLPPRAIKPHDPRACPNGACAPRGPGHPGCMNENCEGSGDNAGQGRIATNTALRHATAEEYAALPLGLMPIDGIARIAVHACDDCAEAAFAPFCRHPPPEPAACPRCGALGEQPCLSRDGVTPRTIGPHAERLAAQPEPEHCLHAHRPDCGIFTDCACAHDDPPPDRPKRPAAHETGPDVSALRIPEPWAQMILHGRGVHWSQVASVASVWTQDNQPALRAEVYRADGADAVFDAHGRRVTDTVLIPITAPQDQAPQG